MIELALIDVYHGINRLLGSSGGELLKRSIELLLLLFVTYMTVSEWSRSRRKDLRLLMYSFGFLAVERFVMSVVYAYAVFANFPVYLVEQYVPVLGQFLETIGLIFLVYAFLYPIYRNNENGFKRNIIAWVSATALLSAVVELLWLWLLSTQGATQFRTSFFGFLFELFQMALIWSALPFFIRYRKTLGKYVISVAVAFFSYSISNLLTIMNMVAYDGSSDFLNIVAQPLPLFSILLFARVMYLKLADKAFLESALQTERKKVEHEQEISKIKDDFVSMVSHELRTPLTSMKLYVSLLKEGSMGKLNNEQKKTLKTIESENNRLAALVTTILDLAKLEQKKISLNPKQIDLYEILYENEYENLAREKNIEVIHSIPKPFPVVVDPDRFRQIFINLFSNAVKFTKEGGTIEISTRKTLNGFEFSVADQGPGMSKEELSKLFTRFYQSNSSATRTVGGTGLGLFIARQLAELHGGTIEVDSIMDRGSVFTVKIPQPLRSQKAQAQPDAQKKSQRTETGIPSSAQKQGPHPRQSIRNGSYPG